jgi:hypothetical protein
VDYSEHFRSKSTLPGQNCGTPDHLQFFGQSFRLVAYPVSIYHPRLPCAVRAANAAPDILGGTHHHAVETIEQSGINTGPGQQGEHSALETALLFPGHPL